MLDIADQLTSISRSVHTENVDDVDIVAVTLRSEFDADIEDVWLSIADPKRLVQWFLPVRGELEEGGLFDASGTSGEILRCIRPERLRVTFGDETSVLDVSLSENDDDNTVLQLEHSMPAEKIEGLLGALALGPGWDSALLGLALFIRGDVVGGEGSALGRSEQVREFAKDATHAWAEVLRQTGEVSEQEIDEALSKALEHFNPPQEQQEQQEQ